MLVVGVAAWVFGAVWGAALAGLSLVGFVIAAWLDVSPQGGGHVHDSGLSAYGVSDTAPPIVPDRAD